MTYLVESPEGRVHSGGGVPAVFDLPPAHAHSLAEAVAFTVGLAEPTHAIHDLLQQARVGGSGSITLLECEQPSRVIAWNEEPGRARVIVAPLGLPRAVVRQAAAADLAAGVTHEVANALTAIAGWTSLATSGGPLPERTRRALEVVQRSAKDALGSARGLLRAMRDAGQPEVPASANGHTNVAVIVEEVLETLRPELEAAGIAVRARLARDIESHAAPASLHLIVSNLVRNSAEAMGAGGTVRITLRERGDRYCIAVADDGPGMSRETLARAFDRYFTTKNDGTGLGLALVRDTIEEAGGQLECETRRGRGTRFAVWLPRAGRSVSARPSTPKTATSGVHPRPLVVNRRFLVVDDDRAMRSMVRTALELHGARVETASGAAEALATEGTFDVALVDLSLGGDRGDALIRQLQEERRIGRAILLTGSADAELDPAACPDMILRKPFELEELHNTLESILHEVPRRAKA